jgi:hypothetical protein
VILIISLLYWCFGLIWGRKMVVQFKILLLAISFFLFFLFKKKRKVRNVEKVNTEGRKNLNYNLRETLW